MRRLRVGVLEPFARLFTAVMMCEQLACMVAGDSTEWGSYLEP